MLLMLLGLSAAPAEAVTVPGNYPTIQAAIAAVVNGSLPNGTLIEVQPGVYNEALLINATSRSLTIRGIGGAAATVVNAGGTGQSAIRIFNASGAIRIEGLTFRGGTGVQGTGGGFSIADASPVLMDVVFENNSGFDSGGGVLSRSNAQFSRCFIRNNSAARFGGGVVITTGSRPVFSNCQIRDNVSGTGGPGVGSIGAGGGVHVNDASPTFRSCLITGNQAKFAAGGIFHMGLFGSPYGPSLLVVEDSEVSNNVVSRYSAADNPGEGGGIHVEDNAVGHLIRTRVLNNTANTSGGLSAYRARFEVISSVIEGNHAQDPQGVGGFGGGIGIHGNNVSTPLRQASSLVLTDSVVRANDARIAAGIQASGDQHCGSPTPNCNPATALRAAVQIIDSLIDGNAAGVYAGGLRLDRADVLIQNSHILSNWAAASGTSYGGGILIALGAQVTINGSTIAGNAAVNFGGGLFVDDSAVLNMTSSRVYKNTAGSGGGLYIGSNGPPSGTIQSSILADNSTYQIHEQACSPLQRTILNYQGNAITPRSGQSDLYYSTCGGATSSASSFNALPGGRASGNTSTAPSFVTFLATPDVGPSVLSWSVSRASSVAISEWVHRARTTAQRPSRPPVPRPTRSLLSADRGVRHLPGSSQLPAGELRATRQSPETLTATARPTWSFTVNRRAIGSCCNRLRATGVRAGGRLHLEICRCPPTMMATAKPTLPCSDGRTVSGSSRIQAEADRRQLAGARPALATSPYPPILTVTIGLISRSTGNRPVNGSFDCRAAEATPQFGVPLLSETCPWLPTTTVMAALTSLCTGRPRASGSSRGPRADRPPSAGVRLPWAIHRLLPTTTATARQTSPLPVSSPANGSSAAHWALRPTASGASGIAGLPAITAAPAGRRLRSSERQPAPGWCVRSGSRTALVEHSSGHGSTSVNPDSISHRW